MVERRPELFRPSRAMIMHPRTLEALRPLGVTQALLARAKPPHIQMHLGMQQIPVQLERYGLAGTAFPHPARLRQSDVEAVLSQALAERGVMVERGVELVDVGPDREHPEAILRTGEIARRSPVGIWSGVTVAAALSAPGSTSPGAVHRTDRRFCSQTSTWLGRRRPKRLRSWRAATGWCSSSLWGNEPVGGCWPPEQPSDRTCRPANPVERRPTRGCRNCSPLPASVPASPVSPGRTGWRCTTGSPRATARRRRLPGQGARALPDSPAGGRGMNTEQSGRTST